MLHIKHKLWRKKKKKKVQDIQILNTYDNKPSSHKWAQTPVYVDYVMTDDLLLFIVIIVVWNDAN